MKIIKLAAESGFKLVITTDHGTVYVKKPSQVVGDRVRGVIENLAGR